MDGSKVHFTPGSSGGNTVDEVTSTLSARIPGAGEGHSHSTTKPQKTIHGVTSSKVRQAMMTQASTSTVSSRQTTTGPKTGGRVPKTQKSKLRAAIAAKEELQTELEKIYEKLKNPTSTRPEIPPETLYSAITSSLLKNPNQKSFLYRMVLIGTHSENEDDFIEWNRAILDYINAHCYSEVASGVLIMLSKYIVHVIEGAEDTLNKYIKTCAKEFEPSDLDWKYSVSSDGDEVTLKELPKFPSVKLYILGIFQIADRAMLGWKFEKLNPAPFDERRILKGGFRKRLARFIEETCVLAICLTRLNPVRYIPPVNLTEEDMQRSKKQYEIAKARRSRAMNNVLPFAEMMDYLMAKKPERKMQLRSPKEHIDFYWNVPHYVPKSQTDWPIPCRTAPYD